MVSTIPTHAAHACAMRSFVISKVRLLSITGSHCRVYQPDHETHAPYVKREDALV